MTDQDAAPQGVDVSRPSIARVYDCLLGGTNNLPVDREVAARALQLMPDAPRAAFANRAFLRRAVRHQIVEGGITQFLDIGSGLPTRGNVHQVAHELDPRVRVVYIDNDPMVVSYGEALLDRDQNAAMITADLRRPEEILASPDVRELIDFERPVGLTLFAILHHINDDEDPVGITARLRAALPPGSHVSISHLQNPGNERPADAVAATASERLFSETLGSGRWREHSEIMGYFGDWDPVSPGLVPLPEWRPAPETSRQQTLTHHMFVGGIATRRR